VVGVERSLVGGKEEDGWGALNIVGSWQEEIRRGWEGLGGGGGGGELVGKDEGVSYVIVLIVWVRGLRMGKEGEGKEVVRDVELGDIGCEG